jgi:hypothetical protein
MDPVKPGRPPPRPHACGGRPVFLVASRRPEAAQPESTASTEVDLLFVHTANRRRPEVALGLKRNQMVVFDGDSLTNRRSTGNPDTWPFLRLMNWDKPWPDMMAEMLFCWRPELNLSFFNAASGGSTCRSLAERFEQRVLARKPDWTIASVAGNDARVGVPPAEYRAIMTAYARRLTREAGGQVLFFGLSRRGPDYPGEKVSSMARRRGYYRILADIAARVKGVLWRRRPQSSSGSTSCTRSTATAAISTPWAT